MGASVTAQHIKTMFAMSVYKALVYVPANVLQKTAEAGPRAWVPLPCVRPGRSFCLQSVPATAILAT